MPFVESDGIRYYQFSIFPRDVVQAVFTRRGGVSPAPWDTLNVGGTVGDDATRVRQNRQKSFAAVGRQLETMFDIWQVHSTDAVLAEAPRGPETPYTKGDIILADRPDVTLYMRFADCVPMFLYDPTRGAIGIAHAGWLGTVRGAANAAVQAMIQHFGSKPAEILAAIGPSIGPDHYEVREDVTAEVERVLGKESRRLLENREGKTYLDLWTASKLQLEQAGVEQVEVSGICTACHLDDWFSHRAERGRTGRFGALFGLQD